MTLFHRLANRFVLCPSRHPIEADGLWPEKIQTPFGHVEAWCCDSSDEGAGATEFAAIKFPGAAGRAERSSPHPTELWQGVRGRVWTINHHGFGASSGEAALDKLGRTCDAVFEHIANVHATQKIVVIGNSLGCLSALYMSARFPVAGMYLRNPPPIAELIRQRPRYNWWSFGLARRVAAAIPPELDCIENATNCRCPALFVSSERDRVVPTRFQQLVFQAYAGHQQTFVIRDARHHGRIPVTQEEEFLSKLDWLRDAAILGKSDWSRK